MGLEAFAIGGFVRDQFLNRDCKDIDIVCNGNGIDLARKTAEKIGIATEVHYYGQYGTAHFQFDGMDIEFVGARKESYREESRNPTVVPGSLEDDQKRRDFTINALALNLHPEKFGELSDPFNGLSDLENRIIKTPLDPGITYNDDPLRMMRAIRFSAQLGFSIEKNSLQAIHEYNERIKIVSSERISDELNKIILSPIPSFGFAHLFDTGLLQIIFPELAALQGVETVSGKSHKDNFYHTLQVLDNLSMVSDDLWLRWAALLHDIAKPATKRFDPVQGWTFHGHEDRGARMVAGIFRKLKLPLNEKMKKVEKLVLLHLRPIVLAQSIVTDSAVRRLLFEAGEDIEDLMQLCHADVTTKNEFKIKKYRQNFELVKQKLLEVEEKDRVRNWQPPVDGLEIMELFGLSQGKEIGILKNTLRDAILDGEIKNDREEALALLFRKAQSLGLNPKSKSGLQP